MNDPKMAVMSINAQLAARDVKEAVGIEDKIKAGMRAVIRENWMDTDDDSMMRAALAAVLMDVGRDSDDGKRILASMDSLRKLSAMLTAAQAGLSINLTDDDMPPDNLLPLIPMWHEAKAAIRGR